MNTFTNYSRAILAIVIMLTMGLPTLAHDFEVDGICYNIIDETAKTIEVTSNNDYTNEYSGCVTIPSSVTNNGTTYSVTEIGSSAFYGCTGLTSITIPNSVISIGGYAFSSCTGLTSVAIGNSVTKIGQSAFEYCTGLTSITIPNSVSEIGLTAFSFCSLTSIIVEKGNSIYDSRDNCNAIIHTATNTLIIGCNNTIIPNSATKIGSAAFYGCTDLTYITIPNSITKIGSEAFSFCSLNSIIVEKGNSIYDSRDNCNAIIHTATNKLIVGCNNTIIPNSVTSIDVGAFSGRSGLTYVIIPNSVVSIGELAFCGCTGLTSITIANSVTKIGSGAFYGCDSLIEVNISDISSWYKIDFSQPDSNPLYYAKKLNLNGNEIKKLVIPNDITEIKDYTFYNCSNLTSISIPNSVTTIGDYAFSGCNSLTSINIPNSVTRIGRSSFYNTIWYNNQIDGVIYINNVLYAYKGTMPNNTSINIKEGIVYISPGAFYDCTGLTSITIPNSVTGIGFLAFRQSGLTSITIPISVIEIEDQAFISCYNLTEIKFNAENCIMMGSLNPEIYYTVFGDCRALKKINIGNNVKTIPDYAFYGCKSLSELTIGNSVAKIGDKAFYNCGFNLITSHCMTPPICADGTFGGDSDSYSASLIVPQGTEMVYDNAIEWNKFSNTQEFTGIDGLEADNGITEVARYDIYGRKLDVPTKGINIVKYSDGTTRKECVK